MELLSHSLLKLYLERKVLLTGKVGKVRSLVFLPEENASFNLDI